MKCHNCANTRVDTRLLVNFMGHTTAIYFCAGCLDNLRQQMQAKSFRQPDSSHGFEQGAYMQSIEADGFPPDAGDEIKRLRRLGELREKLKDAVQAEDYETAAILRDEIYHMEKEVCV